MDPALLRIIFRVTRGLLRLAQEAILLPPISALSSQAIQSEGQASRIGDPSGSDSRFPKGVPELLHWLRRQGLWFSNFCVFGNHLGTHLKCTWVPLQKF